MGRMVTSGLNEFAVSLGEIIEMPKTVKEDMLKSAAKIGATEMDKKAKSMGVYDRNQRYPSAHIADLARMTRCYHSAYSSKIYVYPQGTRKRANTTTRNGEIAFLNEYGKRNQPPRQFMRMAAADCADAATNAEYQVYDRWLKSHDL